MLNGGQLIHQAEGQVFWKDRAELLSVNGPDHVPDQGPDVDVQDVHVVNDGLRVVVILKDAKSTLEGQTGTDRDGDLPQLTA
ncbi:hypothetical protein D3C80_1820430 [compost metagenome]